MERVSELVREPTQMSSQSRQSSTRTLTAEQHAALFAVINKVRMLNGWTTKTAQELDATIRTWAEVFNKHNIPLDAYNDLYLHAFDTRSRKLANGDKDIPLDATLMVASWGPVSEAMKQKRINERRYLPDTAASDCQRCYGAGMEVTPRGARVCNHEPIEA